MSQDVEEQEDRWYANLDNGEVRLMTLEELDLAFQNGEIHERTLVVKAGDEQWQTLAEVAGLEEEPEPAAAPSVSAPAAAPSSPPAVAAPPADASWPPAVASAAPASWPPAVAAAAPAAAPAPSPSPSTPQPSVVVHSVAPVVQDVPVWDLDAPAFKPKRTGLYVAIGAVALVVVGIGVALGSASEETASAAEAPPAVAAPKVTAAAAAPVTAPAAPEKTQAEEKAQGKERFSEEMKAALLAADKERAERTKQKRVQRSTARRPAKSGSVFTKGGSAYDPMNGSL